MDPEKIQLKIETLHYHFRAVYVLSSYLFSSSSLSEAAHTLSALGSGSPLKPLHRTGFTLFFYAPFPSGERVSPDRRPCCAGRLLSVTKPQGLRSHNNQDEFVVSETLEETSFFTK